MDIEKVKRLHENIVKNGGSPDWEPDQDEIRLAETRAHYFIAHGYHQVSAKYRTVARLPEGKTGVQALADASGRPEWAQLLGEYHAGDQYLRCYARSRGDWVELTQLEWAAYRELGGGTYGRDLDVIESRKTETEQLHDAKRTLEAITSRAREFERLYVEGKAKTPELIAAGNALAQSLRDIHLAQQCGATVTIDPTLVLERWDQARARLSPAPKQEPPPLDCPCTDWTMVDYPASAYGPSWGEDSVVREHHPACEKYDPATKGKP